MVVRFFIYEIKLSSNKFVSFERGIMSTRALLVHHLPNNEISVTGQERCNDTTHIEYSEN